MQSLTLKRNFPHLPNYAIYSICQPTSKEMGRLTTCPGPPFPLRPPTFHPKYLDLHLQARTYISELLQYNPIATRLPTMSLLNTCPDPHYPEDFRHSTQKFTTCAESYAEKKLPTLTDLCDILHLPTNFQTMGRLTTCPVPHSPCDLLHSTQNNCTYSDKQQPTSPNLFDIIPLPPDFQQ